MKGSDNLKIINKSIFCIVIIMTISIITMTSNISFHNRANAATAEVAVETGGTFTDSGIIVIQNGVIINYEKLYSYGVTDADIAQWQATAAANGVNNSSSTLNMETQDNTSSTSESNNSANSTESTETTNTSSISSQTVTYTDEEIEAAWEETNRVESTCTEDGYVEYKNTLTGDTKTDTLELAEHDYVETERVESTCTEDGTVTKVCSVCGDAYTEIIPATGHTKDNWVITKESGLFSEGLKQEVCPICGEVLAEQTVPQICPLPLYVVIILVVAIVTLVTVALYKFKRKQNK